MSTSALLFLILFIVIIWGGLAVSVLLLSRSTDATAGELGDSPGTDDDSLMRSVS